MGVKGLRELIYIVLHQILQVSKMRAASVSQFELQKELINNSVKYFV